MIESLDSLLFDDLESHGFMNVITDELGFKAVRFGRFARISWFSKTLVLPTITKSQLNRSGLSSYAVALADYLLLIKGARLRWADRAAVSPIRYIEKLQPLAEHLHRVAYQLGGILDPGALKGQGRISLAVNWGIFLFSFGTLSGPPIQLFNPDEEQAFDYLNSFPLFTGVTGRWWQAKASLQWAFSRVLTTARILVLVTGLYSASSMAMAYAPLLHSHVDFGHALHETFKRPVDREAENQALLNEFRSDLEILKTELANAKSASARTEIQATIDGVEATIHQLESPSKPIFQAPAPNPVSSN